MGRLLTHRNERFATVLFLILFLMVIYQNCGMSPRISDDTVYKLNQANVKALQDLSQAQKQVLCESPSFYSCEHHMMSPTEPSAELTNLSYCTTLVETKEPFCILTNRSVENSAEQLSACRDCSEKDFNPGGRFNNEEIRCHHTLIREGENYPVSFQSTNFSEVVVSLIDICHQTISH